MKTIKILGTGCANCQTTYKLVDEVASAEGIEVQLEKIEDLAQIMAYGVMSTPGVVVDDKVVHSGGIPAKDVIKSWLSDGTSECCGSNSDSSGGCCS